MELLHEGFSKKSDTLFMLQMVKAGNGMSEIGTGVESNETSTGLATYLSKTWKKTPDQLINFWDISVDKITNDIMIPAAIQESATDVIQKVLSTIVGLNCLPLMYFRPCIDDSCM